ncbi:MAG: UPF0182 family protein [Anaerovoracaceae bacterium]
MDINEKRTKKFNKRRIATVIILVVLVLGISLIGFFTDYLWFKELGYVSVFFKQLFTQLKIGVPTFIVMTFLAYIYFKLIKKGYYKKVISNDLEEGKTINAISWGFAALFGGVVTYFAVTKLWFKALQFFHGTSFDLKDPIFNMDVSFYVFKLDFVKEVIAIAIVILAAFIALTLVYYALLMGTRKPRIFKESGSEAKFEEADRFDGYNPGSSNFDEGVHEKADPFGGLFKGTPFEKAAGAFSKAGNQFKGTGNIGKQKPKKEFDNENAKQLLNIASKQLTIAGSLLFLMMGIFFFLKQFDLLHTHSGAVYGAGFTDVMITLWVYRILMALSVLGMIMVIVGIKRHKTKLIAMVPIGMVIVFALGSGAAFVTQNWIVSPNEIAKEGKYLERNIEYTQKAYGLDNVKIEPFAASNDLTSEDIKNNDATISNIRINDYLPAEKFYNQTQSIRQYYTFKDVDVDRYMVNGKYTQTFISSREIDEEKISQTWLNRHLKYTHGYGITLSRVDKVTESGQPDMLVKNIPPESSVDEIKVTRPEIYFGEMTNDYAIVGATEDEFDYPNGDSNAYNRYEGAAGIKLNPVNKVLFAAKEQALKLLVSSNIKSSSKIVINRNIHDRVRKIMPYLEYDNDPYTVVENGKLYWIIDAYTSSDKFPYSEPYSKDTTTNYIRNSIKVVIDAYNGDVDYYVTDKDDPIAETYKAIYPKLFKSGDELPEGLKSHMRVPNKLFDIQARVYSRYHMDDVKVFYQNEDLWDISMEIYGTEEVEMEPSYFIMTLPGEKNAEFVNSIPYTPRDKKNMTGLLVARNDGDNYGELVLYKLPKSKVVYGPRQIEAQIDQDTEISKEFSLWNSSGSTYSRGNMFVIPVEDSLLYVEPVYLESTDSSIPEVKRVIVAYGDKIAYKQTLAEALNSLFGEGAAEESVDTSSKGDSDKTLSQADYIKKANQAYEKAQSALKDGDWSAYGEYMDDLEKALNKL